jgi:hypothetical protein
MTNAKGIIIDLCFCCCRYLVYGEMLLQGTENRLVNEISEISVLMLLLLGNVVDYDPLEELFKVDDFIR